MRYERRYLRMPIGFFLVRVSKDKQSFFIELFADKLNANRKTRDCKSGRKRQGRASGEIDRHGKAVGKKHNHRVFGNLAVLMRKAWKRRAKHHIAVLPERVKFFDKHRSSANRPVVELVVIP